MAIKRRAVHIKLLLVLAFIPVSSYHLFSQSITLKGQTSVNADDFYYVSVLSVKDSSVIDYRYFDTPDFIIENIKQEEFILHILSPLLYKPYYSMIKNEQKLTIINMGLIHLEPDVMNLKEVAVVATPPKMKFIEGKMIYNIRNNTDFKRLKSLDDVLRRIPFLSISDKNEISVFGKKNTIVLINGVEPKNTNWELISPENIKEIEVINNPSAEYNSAGMAVVNIITKKTFTEGFNGQLTASVSKGEFWRSANELQLGYATDKFNVYGNVNYNPYKQRVIETYKRYFEELSDMYNTLDQEISVNKNHSVVLGVDYVPHYQHTIGLQYRNIYWNSKGKSPNINRTTTNSVSENLETYIDGNLKNSKNIYDLIYTYQIDSVSKKLSANLGYVDYSSQENNDISVFSNNGKTNKNSHSKADIKMYTGNVDYLHKAENGITGKAGIYFSHNRNDSYYKIENESGNTQTDSQIKPFDGADIYENKFAGYITFRKQWDKTHVAAGIRYEHVNYRNENKEGKDYSKTYNDLFPSLEAGYNFSEKLQTNLSFSRKVLYPSFKNLDPSIHYVDTFTYLMGNMNLKPEYSYNLGLNIVYNRFINISLAYSRIDNPLTSFFIKRTDPNSLVCLATAENLNSQDAWTASVSVPFQHKIWTMHNSVGINYNDVKFVSEDILMRKRKAMVYFYTYQGFRLPAGFNFSLTYQYNSSGVNEIYYHKSNHIMNCSLNKSVLNDNLIFTLKYDDIFKDQKRKVWTDIQDVNFSQQIDFDSSFVSFAIRYKFGKSTRQYQMKENSKDELRRIK